jgi:hypothetical protein
MDGFSGTSSLESEYVQLLRIYWYLRHLNEMELVVKKLLHLKNLLYQKGIFKQS